MSRTAQTTSTHKGSLFGMVNIASLIYFFFSLSLSLSRKLKKKAQEKAFSMVT
jgi:ABC-type amino acid transport system permease subunit